MDTVMELEIGPGPDPGSYVIDVLKSVGGGEPKRTITIDVDALVDRRPLLEATVLSSSVSARRVMSDTEAVVQEMGRRLFDATFSGEILSAYRTSMAVASERGSTVQIALRLTAPGLAALPWETLFDAESGVYLCRKEPLVRNVPAPHAPTVLSIEPPMRILGMISSPRGLPALDVGGEKERLEEALRPHLDSGRVELEWLDEVTWNGVHARLLQQQWHVLHFIGHGSYDVETDEGVLAFVGRDGRADYVTASTLADLLDEAEPTPRLVVLNSCQSGAAGTTDLFSGTASALAHSGIRAVVAMQFSISDIAAIEFARGFYTALAHGRGIDEAVRSGRIGILGMGRGTLEWVTPVLYLRGDDAKLFDVAPIPGTAPEVHPHTVPTSTPRTVTAPAAVPARPVPSLHSADSGDIPVALIPIVHPDPSRAATPGDTPPPVPPAAAPPAAAAPTAAATPAAPATAASPTAPSPPESSAPGTPPPTKPTHPNGTQSPERRRRPWAPWLIVAILALVIIVAGGILWAPILLDGSGSTGPQATDADSSGGRTAAPRAVVTVPGAGPDVETGVQCAAGEVIVMTASGTLDMDTAVPDPLFGPDGYLGPPSGYRATYADYPPGALVGGLLPVDELDTFGGFVDDGTGTSTFRAEYTCPTDGAIWLGVNDPVVFDNAGGFDVSIW